MSAPVTGIYADLLPPQPAPVLCQLIERAIAAQDAMRAHLATVDDFPAGHWPEVNCAEQDRLDNEFDEARKALADHLLFEHRVGSSLASRIGEVLS